MAHDCGKHGWSCKKTFRRIFIYGALVFIIVALIIIIALIVFAALHPSKPQFTIQDVTLYTFNVSSNPSLLTSTIQVTITSRNPSDHTGIYYDNLGVYATYRDQQISLSSRVPSVYQGHNGLNVWSPILFGSSIPIAPYNAEALAQDQNLQAVDLVIKMTGHVRYKLSLITTRVFHLIVSCPARITFGSQSTGVLLSNNAVKYQLVKKCSVSA